MDAQDIINFITKLPESMQQITDMQVVLDVMEEMDANALSEWQATKAYAKLTGHKTVCVAKEFLRLLHNALHLMHSRKPKKAMASAIKEDVFLISSALEEALKRPGSAEQSFVWQDKTQTTRAIVKRLLSEAPTLVDPAKRRKVMKEVPHYAEIGRCVLTIAKPSKINPCHVFKRHFPIGSPQCNTAAVLGQNNVE